MRRLALVPLLVCLLTACGGEEGQPSPTVEAVALEPQEVLRAEPMVPKPSTTQPPPLIPGDGFHLQWINAAVVPVHQEGVALDPPPDPDVLGWWGKDKKAKSGTTLLLGHTVHTGGGALDDLEKVKAGSVAQVWGEQFTVTKVEVIPKPELAERANDLFNQDGPRRLVVVTCEDYDYKTRSYYSNVVVTAVPLS